MWLFPWLTWAVILFICAALLTMVLEGTYRQEVLYTSALGAVIVLMGVAAQRFGIGGPKAHEPSARKILEQGFNGRREAAALKP